MADTKPMTFHMPEALKMRLQEIAKREQRSLTRQMVVMLEKAADDAEQSK